MYFRCQLIVNGIYYEATDDLKNWDDFELSYKRPDYDGVLRSFSTKFEFVNRAYSLLTGIYRKNYLNAEAGIAFYRRNNSWNWEEVFRCALDFSTYSEDGYTVSINAIDDSLAALIKAKKGIQYEYSVDVISDSKWLHYDRLEMRSYYGFIPYQMDSESEHQNEYIYDETKEYPALGRASLSIPLLEGNYEVTKEVAKMTETKSIYSLFPDKQDETVNDYILKNISSDKTIEIKVDCDFYYETLNGEPIAVVMYGSSGSFPSYFAVSALIQGTYTFSVYPGDTFSVNFLKKSAGNTLKVKISQFKKFSIYIKTTGAPVNIPVVSPNTLLNRLLQSMNGGNEGYTGTIETAGNSRLENTMLLAAESIRNIPHAKLYTSFNKFCEWMEAEFGYVYTISGNSVMFKHRNDFFQNMLSKELGDFLNDYQYNVNSSLIYSSVKVGYEKKDYESINGRDEFRFTNTFSTGIKLTDNTLSLISPYRADAYGIEFLAQKRGEDTTDSESDNDVFMVSVRSDGAQYILNRPYRSDQLSGLISPETMFNFEYSPRFMLEANKSYIGSSASLLQFTSSDGNSDVSINGVKETDDFPIDKGLFTVGEVEISSGDIELPQNLSGYVSFIYNGQPVMGYIKQVKINVGKYEAAKYTLIAKSEEAPEPGI